MTARYSRRVAQQHFIAAMGKPQTEFAQMRITRDAFLATLPLSEDVATRLGMTVAELRQAREEARARLAATACTLATAGG